MRLRCLQVLSIVFVVVPSALGSNATFNEPSLLLEGLQVVR